MKKAKILLIVLSAALIAITSVIGTVAYLTSQDTVVNTFTVGNVNITLDEAKVTPDGSLDGTERVKTNNYHLVPGNTYIKDPTMTVIKGSEEAYVRILVTVNCLKEFDEIYASNKADLTTLFNGYDAGNWIYKETIRNETDNMVTYEFRYKETVKPDKDNDLVLDSLFDSITVPGSFDSADMKSIADLKITVVGNAIQKSGFDSEDAAWAAFNSQING
ncbi:MAG: hypothetical protein E7568_05965 [Ruminococcaceae bacterium]|nr:hypothetical protein [Oscillospiraceae bacterium]